MLVSPHGREIDARGVAGGSSSRPRVARTTRLSGRRSRERRLVSRVTTSGRVPPEASGRCATRTSQSSGPPGTDRNTRCRCYSLRLCYFFVQIPRDIRIETSIE
jgi:hypothetical protein